MDQLGPLCILLLMFGVPLVVGWGLRGVYKTDFSRWAGYMTLKPLVATPLYLIWAGILMSMRGVNPMQSPFEGVALLLGLPGLLLTLWITHRYGGDSFSRRRYAAGFLLLLDFARWGGSSWMTGLPQPFPAYGFMLAGTLPLVFALAAYMLARNDNPFATSWQKSRKLKEDFVYTSITDSIEDSVPVPEPVKQWNSLRMIDGEVAEVVEDDAGLIKGKQD